MEVLQRLRGIYQLAMASLVYPGALHAHVAGQMADELGLDPHERSRFAKRELLPPGLKKEKIHEIITGHLIRNHEPLQKRLGQEKCDELAQLLSNGIGDPILKSIVSGLWTRINRIICCATVSSAA